MAMDPAMAAALTALLVQGGTAAGGALMSHFGKKNPAETTQLPLYGDQEQQQMGQARQIGLQGMQNPYGGFDAIADKARSDLYSKTLPGIAARFGGMNASRSSGFNAAMAGAGQSMEETLNAQRAQYGAQNRNSFANIFGMGLRPQYENMYRPESQGLMQGIGSMLLGGGMEGAMNLAGSLPGLQQDIEKNKTRRAAIAAQNRRTELMENNPDALARFKKFQQ